MLQDWLARLHLSLVALLLALSGHASVAPTTVNINVSRPAARAAAFTPNYAAAARMDRLWRWPRFPLHVFIAGHNDEEKREAGVAMAGFDEWVTASRDGVRYQIVNSPSEADVTVRFTTDEYLNDRRGVVGETHVSGRGGVLFKAEMRLATGGASDSDLQTAAAHEFGHALGIGGHSNSPKDLMYPSQVRYLRWDQTPIPSAPRHVTRRDLNTLRVCYPDLTPPG
ncbi:hypothetical protein CCAX7_15880 [Capsulimonas corticalis]|uniref:Uncharacterized protein n=1 Tax=Capsulimonas corticalis TaxID=2219043 RepID=A0A402CZ23_9BACT|nr:matrixin family metalloprotease [Capsulimonas corticalis]BDI29537.1 hypothetical protein CCAX7_15880 [Capsulimonas corticalis]